jgi:hypothetical protein
MDLSHVNELAIIVSSLLALALGSIWYSPLVFGKLWQRAANLTDADLEFSRPLLIRSLVVGFLSNIVFMYVIASLLRIGETAEFSAPSLAGLLIALLGASVASMVVWEKKSLAYFVIHVGYGVLIVLVGTAVLALWPW